MSLVSFVLLGALLGAAEGLGPDSAPPVPPPSLVGLPPVGPWLLDQRGSPARWLGHPYQGRTLLEPINVVVIDPFAGSADEASRKVLEASAAGGFGVSLGHSCGYQGLIGGRAFSQLPVQKNTAFSDGMPFSTNDHGRLLGPARSDRGWVFTGGFSRESFHLWSPIHHQFVSFNQAREAYGRKVTATGRYRIVGYLSLGNVAVEASTTTGDHDGRALVVEALR